MSTVQEQLAALRAGTIAPAIVTEQAEVTSNEDKLLTSIFELGLFDAIVPMPDGERIFEYEDRRKTFNLILHDFISEQLNAVTEQLTQEHAEELADVHTRLTETQNSLENALRRIDEEVDRVEEQQRDYDKLEDEYRALKEAFEKSKEEKKYEAPSEPLKNRIASLKQLSADDMVKRFEERQASKSGVTLPGELQFRTETSEAQLGNGAILPTAEVPQITFPLQKSGSEEIFINSESGEVVSQAIRDYVEEKLQSFALKNNLAL